MKVFFISIILFFWISCDAQSDSLLYQLQQIENDTERVNQIYNAGFAIRNINPQRALIFAEVCKTESEKAKSPKHIAKGYNLLGILFYKKGDLSSALTAQKKSLQLNKKINYQYGIAVNEINLGNIYSDKGNFGMAESSYLSALNAYNTLGNSLQITKCLVNLGVLKFSLKQYGAAVNQFHEALTIANQLNALDVTANCYNNIGAIYMVEGKLDSAKIYLEEGLKQLNLQDNELEMADVYNNMANVSIQLHDTIDARAYLKLARDICTKYDYTDALIELYHSYSLFYESKNNYKEANAWLKKHYALKDSLARIDDRTEAYEVNENNLEPYTMRKQGLNNQLILVVLFAMVIGIPLFLLKFKR